ncbi:MAG TPA: hypothetical protein VF168_10725 [Trueperaceae bacterium]
MKFAGRVAQRVAQPDAQQYLALYLIAMLFALMAAWPTDSTPVNDAWFTLAYTRAAALGLLGLGYGASKAAASPAEQALTAAMLGLFALLALPLELAAYAASYPATPLPWVVPLPALTALAMYGLGLLLGKFLGLLRLQPLVPIAVPAALAGMVALDVGLGLNLLNPFTAAVRVSWAHLALLGSATTALIIALARGLHLEHRSRGAPHR